MNEITAEQALQFVSWLAQFDCGKMPKPFKLTEIQNHIGVTDVDVWLANVSCSFRGGWAYEDGGVFHGKPCPPRRADRGDVLIGWNDGAGREIKRRNFTDTEMRCFDRLREKYYVLVRSKQADDPNSQHEARPLVHGMVIDDSVARRDMKQIVVDYLTEASKNAELELLEAAAFEEKNNKKEKGSSKKSKRRAKQKRKKSKGQERHAHDDLNTLNDENRDQKECQNGGTSSQTEQQECSALPPSTAESKSSIMLSEEIGSRIEPSVPMTRPIEEGDRVRPDEDGPNAEEFSV